MPDMPGCPFCGREPEVAGGKVASCPNQDCPIYDWCMTPEEWCRRVPGPATSDLANWLRRQPIHILEAMEGTSDRLDAFIAEWPERESSRPEAAGDGDGD
jgi:hypothetical protein